MLLLRPTSVGQSSYHLHLGVLPGIQETAINVYKKFIASNQKTVFNPLPYQFLEDAKDELNDFISRVSDAVSKQHRPRKTTAPKSSGTLFYTLDK